MQEVEPTPSNHSETAPRQSLARPAPLSAYERRLTDGLDRITQVLTLATDRYREAELVRLAVKIAELKQTGTPALHLQEAAQIFTEAQAALRTESQRPEMEAKALRHEMTVDALKANGIPWERIFRAGRSDGGTCRAGEREKFPVTERVTTTESAGFPPKNRPWFEFKDGEFEWSVIRSKKGWSMVLAAYVRSVFDELERVLRAKLPANPKTTGRKSGVSKPEPFISKEAALWIQDYLEYYWPGSKIGGDVAELSNLEEFNQWIAKFRQSAEPRARKNLDECAQKGLLNAPTLCAISNSRKRNPNRKKR